MSARTYMCARVHKCTIDAQAHAHARVHTHSHSLTLARTHTFTRVDAVMITANVVVGNMRTGISNEAVGPREGERLKFMVVVDNIAYNNMAGAWSPWNKGETGKHH